MYVNLIILFFYDDALLANELNSFARFGVSIMHLSPSGLGYCPF